MIVMTVSDVEDKIFGDKEAFIKLMFALHFPNLNWRRSEYVKHLEIHGWKSIQTHTIIRNKKNVGSIEIQVATKPSRLRFVAYYKNPLIYATLNNEKYAAYVREFIYQEGEWIRLK